jgi:tetratricopeptide (TPR) repeat protein
VWLVGYNANDLDGGDDWAALALVEIEGIPRAPVSVVVHQAAGMLAEHRGDGPRAVEQQEQALAVARRYYGADHYLTANAELNLAGALDVAGRSRDAIALYRAAMPRVGKTFGDSIARAHALSYFAVVLGNAGEHAEAQGVAAESLAVGQAAGAAGADLAGLLLNQGSVLLGAGRDADAVEPLTRAHELYLAAAQPALAAQALSNRGSARANLAVARDDAALDRLAVADLTAAAQALEDAWGADHPDVALDLGFLAALHADRGRCGAAEAPARRAVAIYERDPASPDTADPLITLGRCALAARQPARAVPLLERATGLRHAGGMDPLLTAESDAWLGLALAAAGRDPARAATLLHDARAQLATAPDRFAAILGRIDALRP